MSTEPPKIEKPPGFLWIVILGVVGFCAGFFGPLIFAPDADQGPLVGILMTGPGGLVLGLLFFALMKFLPVAARAQWILLIILSVAATLATCYFVQPEPSTRGYLLDVKISRMRAPAEAADEVIADWNKQIARATWASPRPGWEQQMRAALGNDQDTIIEAVLVRQRAIKMHRKLWNRGQLFVAEWQPVNEMRSYYIRKGDVTGGLAGAEARLFIDYDSTAPIRASDVWPPLEPETFIGLSRVMAVPEQYRALP